MASSVLCCFTLCCDPLSTNDKHRARRNRRKNGSRLDSFVEERKPLLPGQVVDITDAERRAFTSCQNVTKMINRGATSMVNRSKQELVIWVTNMARYEEEKPIFRRIAEKYFPSRD